MNSEPPPLGLTQVAVAASLLVATCVLSLLIGADIEVGLAVAGLRCTVQLAVLGAVLDRVFAAQSPFVAAGLLAVMLLAGAAQVVFVRAAVRHSAMFLSVLLALTVATVAVSLLTTAFCLNARPAWTPRALVPVAGMVLGNAISGVSIALDASLRLFTEHQARLQVYLAFGATRWELGRDLLLKPAVRLALTPIVTQMSIMGLVAIPGTLTGSLLIGGQVAQAIKYQQILMFVLSASTAISVILAVLLALVVCIDSNHQLRLDRIHSFSLWQTICQLRKHNRLRQASDPEAVALLRTESRSPKRSKRKRSSIAA
ncbi:UPF0014 membrane protein [Neolecta irregularis DAH-3]|uniref:UPF0014 membrane protein n=1 Tax=Neolecta irregularis (strain DAH-3) TaxID=1198029 RepID=A0A1U7LLT4_NEOID|nr:UPF0014 membrane protein [Neolecta irregularis DAH-3]|eukprot:OLL23607.1 UPF0014 membrane protein [Neolecta irregularis DAH-3]